MAQVKESRSKAVTEVCAEMRELFAVLCMLPQTELDHTVTSGQLPALTLDSIEALSKRWACVCA